MVESVFSTFAKASYFFPNHHVQIELMKSLTRAHDPEYYLPSPLPSTLDLTSVTNRDYTGVGVDDG